VLNPDYKPINRRISGLDSNEAVNCMAMTLREVMHAHIPILTIDATVRDAVDKMDIYQFPGLVVVDENRRPIRVLTEGDLCRAVTTQDSLVGMCDDPAFIYGTMDPICLAAETEIGEAFHRMLSSGLTLLPVLEDDVLAGIVLRVDLMQAMLMDAGEAV